MTHKEGEKFVAEAPRVTKPTSLPIGRFFISGGITSWANASNEAEDGAHAFVLGCALFAGQVRPSREV